MSKRKNSFFDNHSSKRRDTEEDDNGISSTLLDDGMGGAGTSGARGQHKQESIMPLQKALAVNNIQNYSVKYFRREWYEIDTRLHGIPSQHLFNSLFNNEFLKRINQLGATNTSHWIYVKPFISAFRLSNPIVLSDNIQTTNGVNEVSSFVQNHKILHFCINPHTIGPIYHFGTSDSDTPLQTVKSLQMDNLNDKNTNIRLLEPFDGDYSLNDVVIEGIYNYDIANNENIESYSTKIDQGRFLFKIATEAGKNTEPKTLFNGHRRTIDNFNFLKNYDCCIIDAQSEVNIRSPKYQTSLLTNTANFMGSSNTSTLLSLAKETNTEYTTAISSGGDEQAKAVYGWAPIMKNFGPKTIADFDNNFTDQQLKKQLIEEKCHDYFTLVPITKSDGTIMKVRANIMVECEYGISLTAIPRTMGQTADSSYSDFLAQNNDISPGVWPNIMGYNKTGLSHFVF